MHATTEFLDAQYTLVLDKALHANIPSDQLSVFTVDEAKNHKTLARYVTDMERGSVIYAPLQFPQSSQHLESLRSHYSRIR